MWCADGGCALTRTQGRTRGEEGVWLGGGGGDGVSVKSPSSCGLWLTAGQRRGGFATEGRREFPSRKMALKASGLDHASEEEGGVVKVWKEGGRGSGGGSSYGCQVFPYTRARTPVRREPFLVARCVCWWCAVAESCCLGLTGATWAVRWILRTQRAPVTKHAHEATECRYELAPYHVPLRTD